MAFLETPRINDCPSFGFTGGPSFSTAIAELDSGVEYANRNWEQSRHQYVMSFDARKPKVVNDLIGFFMAVGGQHGYFRLKDPIDHTDSDVGGYVATSASGVFSVIDLTHYQMHKRYTCGALVHNRKIQKPVVGKISVTGGSGVSIDYTTGIVTSTGAPTSWTGPFDTPVRFATDVMRAIIVAKNNTNLITGWQQIELIEVRLL